MKLIILKEKLKEGLKTVEKISQKSLKLPILQNILLKTEKNILKLSTTNLESSINWQSLAQVKKEGSICIPTKILSGFISSLPDKTITIESSKNNSLKIECGNYKTKIKGLDPEDFPVTPEVESKEEIKINSKKFCEALNQVISIPTSSSTKPEITGIYFVFKRKEIKMVATDSFRLAEKKINIQSNLKKEYSLILPQMAAKELLGVLTDKKGDLKIKISPNLILFQHLIDKTSQSEIKFISRLIEGRYPNYEEIIPDKYKTTIQVNKEEFLNQVKSASLFSGKINEVKIKINQKEKNIEISSQHSDLGEYKSSLKGVIKGNNIKINFNYRFLIDGISEIQGDKVQFKLTSKEGPATLSSVNSKDEYLYIIMPIKAN